MVPLFVQCFDLMTKWGHYYWMFKNVPCILTILVMKFENICGI
uniref:Uncharacterized protein n=1 Tax=Rhizophora mucronata TaxID=61149 RepID=A0A2P2Q949_RHIMU